MLSVPSCKWSRSLGGEYVDGASCIYAVFVWRIPGALGKSGDTFGYPVGDLSRDLYLPPVIVYKDHVTIVNIKRKKNMRNAAVKKRRIKSGSRKPACVRRRKPAAKLRKKPRLPNGPGRKPPKRNRCRRPKIPIN